MKKFASFIFLLTNCLFVVREAYSQQPSWQNIRMGCTHSQFINTKPVEGTTCTCTDCVVGTNNSCTQATGNTSIATYGQGAWRCTNTGASATASSLPVYLWAHFRDDDQHSIRLSYSHNALDWFPVNKNPAYRNDAISNIRDPSITVFDNKFYLSHSPGNFAAVTTIPLIRSSDLITFEQYASFDVSTLVPGATAAWGPVFWHDPNDNQYYIWAAVSTHPNPFALNSPFTPYLFKVNLTTGTVLSFNPVTLNGTYQNKTYDYVSHYANGVYYILYVDQTPFGDGSNDIVHQPIAYATASNLLGPYTQQSPAGVDYFGFTDQTEAPDLIPLDNGCVRISIDRFILPPVGPGSGGRTYYQEYKDSCGPNFFTPGSMTPTIAQPALKLRVDQAENGQVVKLPPGSNYARIVQTARDHFAGVSPMAHVNGPFGINTYEPKFTLSVAGRAEPPGFITYNEIATLGVTSGGGEYATLSSCGSVDASCATPYSSVARWVQQHGSNGDQGMHQFNNSNADTGEASVQFSTGARAFGRRSMSVSKLGDKSLWSLGSNKLNYGDAGSNRFFIYNRGTGTEPFISGQTVGTLTNATSGCYGMRVLVGANPINVTHIGRWIAPGNIGNHKMYILNSIGNAVATYNLDATTAGTNGTGYYVYTPIENAGTVYYTMNAGTVYYIMSKETAGGDSWYDAATTVTPDAALGTVTDAAFQTTCGVGIPALSGGANRSFGPVNFLWTATGAYGSVMMSIDPTSGEMHSTFGITLGSGLGSAYDTTNYANIDAFGSFPPGPPRINLGTGPLGNASAKVMMGKVRVGAGDVPNSYVAWFQEPNLSLDTGFAITANAGRASVLHLGIWPNGPKLIGYSDNNFSVQTNTTFPELLIKSTTGSIYATWGLQFGSGLETGYAAIPNYVSIDAFGSAGASADRLNLGTGTLGTSDATVMMGRARIGAGGVPATEELWVQAISALDTTDVYIIGNASRNAQIILGQYPNGPVLTGSADNNFSVRTNPSMPELFVLTSTAGVLANWGFQLGAGLELGTGTVNLQGNIDAYGSGTTGVKRINFGTGALGSSDGLLVGRSIDLSGYIGRRGGGSTDLAGFVLLDGAGVGTKVLTNTAAMAAGACVCTTNSSLAACQAYITAGSVLNLRGPASASVTYICIGSEF